MGLQGSLDSINLADIMQLVSNSKQNGRFVLSKGIDNKGYIYIKSGEIIHSSIGNYAGEDAVFTLIAWSNGEFVFEEGVFDVNRSITRPITLLLMEAARRIDEWNVLRRKIGSIDSVPIFNDVNKDERRKISLTTLEWLIIAKIDGHKSIEEISNEAGINIYDTSRILFGMISAKLLKLKS